MLLSLRSKFLASVSSKFTEVWLPITGQRDFSSDHLVGLNVICLREALCVTGIWKWFAILKDDVNCWIQIYIGKNQCIGVILLTRPLINSSALSDITFITARQLGDLSCSFHRKSFFIGSKADRPQIIKSIDRLLFSSGFIRQYKSCSWQCGDCCPRTVIWNYRWEWEELGKKPRGQTTLKGVRLFPQTVCYLSPISLKRPYEIYKIEKCRYFLFFI